MSERRPKLIARALDVLDEAVSAGVVRGWNRAHKHTDKPDPVHIRSVIVEAVTDEIAERFDLGGS